MAVINISRDFSQTPGGRFRAMGPDSGQAFRDELLRVMRRRPSETFEVILDGAEGYGSSFLEEAFGGLIRLKLIPAEEAFRRIKIVAQSPKFETYAIEARQYMKEAAAQLNG